jgi:hypothetical protein
MWKAGSCLRALEGHVLSIERQLDLLVADLLDGDGQRLVRHLYDQLCGLRTGLELHVVGLVAHDDPVDIPVLRHFSVEGAVRTAELIQRRTASPPFAV